MEDKRTFELKRIEKNYNKILLKYTAVPNIFLSSCYIRTHELQAGKIKVYTLRFREKQQISVT